jgi:hypothetical protein
MVVMAVAVLLQILALELLVRQILAVVVVPHVAVLVALVEAV